MGLFQKFRDGLRKTQEKLTTEIKRIVTRGPKLDAESLEELDLFIDAMKSIAQEAIDSPELIKSAPSSTRLSRLDETAAARDDHALLAPVERFGHCRCPHRLRCWRF